ncbi:ATP-binding protein [Labrenzia sp. OB1]|uniref:ATP-binding protein n=1 Tax=Labrenzia sp. OB1 TaxID=1561204 RepID=UPI0007B1ED9F|nr:ATP-binding protein [Labrenzia sp. OB1]KZM47764.1 histidine kinase [Labrenzia sp. OB1]
MTSESTPAGEPQTARKPQRSLAGRLVFVAAVWATVALALAGIFLVSLYQSASERAFDSQLEIHINALISGMLETDAADNGASTTLSVADYSGDPRFSLPLSGWYWTVRQAGNAEIIGASKSLVGDPLDVPAIGDKESGAGFVAGPGGDEIRVLQQNISVGETPYIIAVAAATADFWADIYEFGRMAALTLCIVGLGLILAIFLQVRIGLKPLARLEASLSAVRQGEAERIDEALPREIAPLAVELNALIGSNKEIVERARTHVGNLAHGLKTPLSVISNEARTAGGPLADKVSEQAQIMSTQIQHHLERARMAAQRRVIGVSCETEPVLSRLIRAMNKIYQDKGIAVGFEQNGEIRFRGESQDLEEMGGNLIDNACKWAASRASVTVASLIDPATNRDMFTITVEDDGPGLTPEERAEAVKRGRRLDETVPGTGLGLSIVADLAALYGGTLELDGSALGGLKARLTLPALVDRR